MKHAPSVALILLLGLVGCAEQEHGQTRDVTYVPAPAAEPQPAPPVRQAVPAGASPMATGSLPGASLTGERALRNERLVYAQGLERILLTNGMPANVRVQEEGHAGPVPALMFFGHFEASFVKRAVTEGAVLERARALGFRSVEFIGRGPDGNYLFEISKTAPLPRCAAYDRLCL
jgi:hypothetical protein